MSNDNKQLTIVREFNTSRQQVFKAWTDEEQLAKWWGPNGVTNPVCRLDVKVGGEINIVMLAGDELGDLSGSKWPMTGVFQEITPPVKIVYTSSALVDDRPIMDCLNTVTFEESQGKTKMTLSILVTRATPEAEGPLSGMEIGWNQSLDKLNKFLEL